MATAAETEPVPAAVRAARLAWMAIPAALVVFASFRAAGFFADTPALIAAGLLVLLALRVVASTGPAAGIGRGALVGAGLLMALAGWMLLSSTWSHAPGRAVVEADRTLAYALVLVTAAVAPRRAGSLEALLRLLALAATAVAVAALASRLAPDVLHVAPDPTYPGRLAWPLTYWNALGLLAGLGLLLCLHVAAGRGRTVPALACAALPLLAATAVLTFSRGSLAVTAIMVVAYVLLARAPRLGAALLAGAPAVLVAGAGALAAGALAGDDPSSAAAAAQGHRVAVLLVVLALAGGLARRLLETRRRGPARRLPSLPLPLPRRRAARAAIAGSLVVVAIAATAVALRHQGGGGATAAPADARSRLVSAGSSGRSAYWRVARETFADHPFAGMGAGTYVIAWDAHRPYPATVVNAHSLPLETLAELGLVGVALLAAALAAIARALLRLREGVARPARIAALVAIGGWALHACFDFDWQMPAITLWVFAIAGVALARPASVREPSGASASGRLATRAAVALALLVIAAAPALVAISEIRLRGALGAYAHGDCAAATDDARASHAALALRAEPSAVLGFCAARRGATTAALADLREAERRDPAGWEWPYGAAVVLQRAARPATAELARAAALNPLQPEIQALRVPAPPATQKRRAAMARLFLQDAGYPPLGQ